ncbi:cysteine-rich repeat secretory protein 38-like [Cucumis melo]|uniref:Cysteine-rich repeat secretory protein 38-like n=1 Tax=Cucumis melo TaxID=3656 RepID=A0A1S3B4F5_CUCME|nr:cysteine-rich repeat secretory protein 38-like [Cucumis melo]
MGEAFKFVSTLYLSTTLLLIIFGSFFCCADENLNCAQQCSKSDSFTTENDFKANLKNLLDSLAENGPLFRGFYSTSNGESSNQIFGLVQCRGDVSSINCGSCIKNSSAFALSECPESKDVMIWFRWCFLRYSTDNFIGVLSQTSVAIFNDTNYDDPSLVSYGLSLMSGLASSASYQNLMFQIDVLDAGMKGKRYGMAQCTRDIGGSDCAQCLNSQLATFRTTIGSKKDWEIYGFNCFMWYHDHPFYFNFSTSAGGRWSFPDGGRTICISLAVLMMVLKIL